MDDSVHLGVSFSELLLPMEKSGTGHASATVLAFEVNLVDRDVVLPKICLLYTSDAADE